MNKCCLQQTAAEAFEPAAPPVAPPTAPIALVIALLRVVCIFDLNASNTSAETYTQFV